MSSLIFLGFSVIMFFTSVGIMFLLMPMVLGGYYTLAVSYVPTLSAPWQAAYYENETTVRWLVQLIPGILIFVAGIKIFMVASARGRD